MYSIAIAVLGILPLALAADVNYTFNIVNGNVSPDGFTRNGVLVNGTFPGPLITANKDDTLHVTVNNQLTSSEMRKETSIHWHGLFQHRTAGEDGVAFVSQCPIVPGQSYTYNFPLNGQSGTYWYHSHLSTQYVDGLRGPIVIYDPDDPLKAMYDVDDASTVITLDDWYQTSAVTLDQQLFGKDGGDDPVPDSGLINGKGRFVGGSQTPWSVISVESGKRYRFRIINSSAYARYEFSFNGHQMTVIEADGVLHQPLTVDRLTIMAGQRYSVIVNATQTVGSYWIAAPMDVEEDSDNKHFDSNNIAAILRYSGAPEQDPAGSPSSSGVLLSENNLKPLQNPGAPGVNDGLPVKTIDIDFDHSDSDGKHSWSINGIQYVSPELPTLLTILSGSINFNQSQDTVTLDPNVVYELHLHGSDNGYHHPIHLHGHNFDVVQSADGGGANYADPPRRDVVGWHDDVTIRFRTDNPGPWMLHCHIDWHLEAGMAMVFAESPTLQQSGNQSVQVENNWQQLCPSYQAFLGNSNNTVSDGPSSAGGTATGGGSSKNSAAYLQTSKWLGLLGSASVLLLF